MPPSPPAAAAPALFEVPFDFDPVELVPFGACADSRSSVDVAFKLPRAADPVALTEARVELARVAVPSTRSVPDVTVAFLAAAEADEVADALELELELEEDRRELLLLDEDHEELDDASGVHSGVHELELELGVHSGVQAELEGVHSGVQAGAGGVHSGVHSGVGSGVHAGAGAGVHLLELGSGAGAGAPAPSSCQVMGTGTRSFSLMESASSRPCWYWTYRRRRLAK